MKRFRLILAGAAAFGTIGMAAAGIFGDILTDLLKIGGVGLVVDKLGPEMNKALNNLQNFSPSEQAMTKVVPILSVSNRGKHVGAAQVMGPRSLVQKVTAVAQLETSFMSIRLKAMIPVESKDVVKDIRRVPGVGVSGVVELKI